jgi:hypothetical protein
MQMLEEYIIEMDEDVKFDDFSLKDTQMKLPAIKHKWVGRLIRHKNDLNRAKAERFTLVKALAEKLKKTSPYKLSDAAAEKACYKHEDVVKLSSSIQEYDLIIEFLEKTERVLNSMTYDIKNIVEIMKLETL